MDRDEEIQDDMKPAEEKIIKETEPQKKSSFQWLTATLLVFLSGLALFWYLNQPHHDSHLFPLKSLVDPSLVTLKTIDLKEPLKQSWKEHVFKSHTSYQVENDSLHALSQGNSSMLYQEVNINLSDRPFLTWEWKAIQFPTHKKSKRLADKSDNDFAGRVYAIFKGRSPIVADVIQYVWDDRYPEGTSSDSPFLKNVRILVVQSGKSDEWVSEKRDLLEDYQKLFGRRPRWPLSAVGVMSDSDNTQTQSEIYFRNFSVKKLKSG